MAIGGFKFKGYYCERGSLSLSEWTLLMHKTKVAAFMGSSALSNAGWDYYMSGSPDGIYHCMDSVGNNYVTVFYNSTTGTYFALYTLSYFTESGTAEGSVKVTLPSEELETTNAFYIGYYCSNFFKIGTSRITYSTSYLTTVYSYQSPLYPMGNIAYYNSSLGENYRGNGSGTVVGKSTYVMFGFAIKADNIVMFQWQGSGYNSSYLKCTVASGHGYSSFVNTNDTSGLFILNTQSTAGTTYSSCYESSPRYAKDTTGGGATPVWNMPLCFTTTFNSRSYVNKSWLMCSPLARYTGSTQNYPFQSLDVTNITNSETYITGKGTVNIELLAINFPGFNQSLCPSIFSSVANGNYLCVRTCSGSSESNVLKFFSINAANTSSYISCEAALYVGWDPSNPTLTDSSSWQKFTE